ncbi:MAG: hypothetical protein KGJ23_13585 [Euryarchaeota archaeon]|nr:hypothetical protein [Euryarchaeota archaeon]MDE1880821.1 hypothetical protein [Euryarchaeota archaeon]MDE2045940.1 hypothetical protein [Thermoplasmata archaeon]
MGARAIATTPSEEGSSPHLARTSGTFVVRPPSPPVAVAPAEANTVPTSVTPSETPLAGSFLSAVVPTGPSPESPPFPEADDVTVGRAPPATASPASAVGDSGTSVDPATQNVAATAPPSAAALARPLARPTPGAQLAPPRAAEGRLTVDPESVDRLAQEVSSLLASPPPARTAYAPSPGTNELVDDVPHGDLRVDPAGIPSEGIGHDLSTEGIPAHPPPALVVDLSRTPRGGTVVVHGPSLSVDRFLAEPHPGGVTGTPMVLEEELRRPRPEKIASSDRELLAVSLVEVTVCGPYQVAGPPRLLGAGPGEPLERVLTSLLARWTATGLPWCVDVGPSGVYLCLSGDPDGRGLFLHPTGAIELHVDALEARTLAGLPKVCSFRLRSEAALSQVSVLPGPSEPTPRRDAAVFSRKRKRHRAAASDASG